MKYYISQNEAVQGGIVLDDVILTKDLPTSAGSKMLDGYMSLFDAEVVNRLTAAGYAVSGKANIGEMAIDLLGESSYYGPVTDGDSLIGASVALVREGKAYAAVGMDANGTPRRAAALGGGFCMKPTYGTVSRFGTVSLACSGETITVTAATLDAVKAVLDCLIGHDDKDGTSLPEEKCLLAKSGAPATPKRVALAKGLLESTAPDMQERVRFVRETFAKNGIEVAEIDDSLLLTAKAAWNVLMSAELCNNVSRYDGVKYGYRTKNYKTIDELYTNSRTEAFGPLLKTAILFGSETLSTENYMKVYDKALRMRRVISERLCEILSSFDAILLPAASKSAFTLADTAAKYTLAYDENLYTAPASISGLPAIAFGGVQLIGKAFSENTLYALAELYEKEGK